MYQMSTLKKIREQRNLTQEELSSSSGISARTIQRIEAGTIPKGQTLRLLAFSLAVREEELQESFDKILEEKKHGNEILASKDCWKIKVINLSSIPFVILPPLNILLPLFLMLVTKKRGQIVKQVISVQIMWSITAPILFLLVAFLKLGNTVALITIVLLVLSNIFIIIRNAIAIDRNKSLFYKLNFSMI